MIQIGTKVWIVDDLGKSQHGSVDTLESKVYYERKLVGGVNFIEMKWDSRQGMGRKILSIHAGKSGSGEELKRAEELAEELANHGFNVEIIYTFGDFKHVEYYLLDGKMTIEEKLPCSQDSLKFSKKEELDW